MPRAILRDGVIYPLEPLPPEWSDGKELLVEEALTQSPEEIDRWFAELEQLCAASDPEEDRRLQETLEEVRLKAKPW